MLRFFLVGILFSLVLVPATILAQEAQTEAEAARLFFSNNSVTPCFEVYPYGKLTMNLSAPVTNQPVAAGDLVGIAGSITNTTHSVLPNGRVFVRVLREDASVADQQWHPIVAEFLINDVSVPAATEQGDAKQSFTSSWQVPAFAPAGNYRLELSYLAADGSPIIGVPYVPNMSGAAASFSVRDGGVEQGVTFDRSRTKFNGDQFIFRAAPPSPSAGPLTVQTMLLAFGNQPIPVNIKKSLYAWTDVEGDTLISETVEPAVLSSNSPATVSFSWPSPQPGVYELVFKALPLDPTVLPSIVRVRFYYEGNVPRILHAGMASKADGSALVGACFFNSTFGPDGGSGILKVESAGQTLETLALDTLSGKTMAKTTLSAAVVDAGFTLIAEAKDKDGAVTDTERVSYPPAQLAPTNQPAPTAMAVEVEKKPWYLVGAGVVALLALVIIVYWRRRSTKTVY